MFWLAILLATMLSTTFAYIWLRYKFNYWRSKNVTTPTLASYLEHFKMGILQLNSIADRDLYLYEYFKAQKLIHAGTYFYFVPIYIPLNLKIIKHILQVDHQYFSDRGLYVNERGDPLSAHLFSLGGEKWRNLRKKLTPSFTSGKMKMMFQTILDCTVDLENVMNGCHSDFDVKDIMARYTTDVIGNVAFGVECNSLKNPTCEFREKGRRIFHTNFYEAIKLGALYAFPDLMQSFNVKMVDPEASEFFMNVVKDTVNYREKNQVYRRDFMHLLIQLKNRSNKIFDENTNELEDPITLNEIAAQAFIFFEAGYESSSNTISFCLYELALNGDIQERVRNEITTVLDRYGGVLTYDAVEEMKFLDQVLCETLRKYPPLSSLYRVCCKTYKIPDTDIILDRGTRVVIPVYGIHHDPDYYPEPEKFNPERFSSGVKSSRPDCTFMPFGFGPRICIGYRLNASDVMFSLVAVLGLLIAIVYLSIYWIKKKYSFWKDRGVITPLFRIGWGNYREIALQKKCFSELLHESYNYFKSKGVKHGGLYNFTTPVYVPVDINIVKSILQNDFDYFAERGLYCNQEDDPLNANLFTLGEHKWRPLRALFSPAFSAAKLRMMFEALVKCTEDLEKALTKFNGKSLEIKEFMGRFSINLIGSCAFGIDCNCFEEPNNEFRVNGASLFHKTTLDTFKVYLTEFAPNLMKKLHISISKPSAIEFFKDLVQKTMDYREKNNIIRKDFMHLLIQLKNRGILVDTEEAGNLEIENGENKVDFDDLVGQAYVFFIAGYESPTNAIVYSLYFLAIYKEIQDRARREIKDVLSEHKGKLTYEALSEMKFNENIVKESMRYYPPVHVLNRVCTKDYQVPDTDLVLKKGQDILIPVLGIQRDEEHYPNPEMFDPDRFSNENVDRLRSGTFLPLGLGPRNCIGLRLGMAQSKIAVVTLIRHYEISLNEKTKSPLEFDPAGHPLTLPPKGGIWLNLKKV